MNQKLVRDWMKKEGWDMGKMASAFEVDYTTMWRRLSGRVKPDYAFLVVLARLVGCTVIELKKDTNK